MGSGVELKPWGRILGFGVTSGNSIEHKERLGLCCEVR